MVRATLSLCRLRWVGTFAFVHLLAGCGPGTPRESFPGAPVVLISVDTLRSDRLPFYGYAGVKTPALSALAKDSILYERAYSHVPLTLPSHASLFTGELPARHGIHDNLGYRLRPTAPTLAELLKKKGYATGGAVSCYVLKADSGISRGFDFYDDEVEPAETQSALGRVQRAGAETESHLRTWLAAQTQTQRAPFFAFLHIYEPHTPYEPPEPFKSQFKEPYDGEIAAADAIVGRFLAFLKEKGLYDKSLIFFLSDHGEALGEHGEEEHGMFLYRETLQVPLLIKLPGSRHAGSAIPSPVALSDIFATIGRAVDLADFEPPQGTVSLIDLLPGQTGSPPPKPRRLFAETFFPRIHFGWSDLASLMEGRWHYIEAPRPEIYDLETDPGEKNNRIAEKPDSLRALRIDLSKRRASFEAPQDVDPEARKKLAALGYLSAGPSSAATGPLDDPKDRIGTFEELRKGMGEMTGGRPEKANEIFTRLLAENPRMLDVWDMKARTLAALGRSEESLAALKKTVELAPEAARGPYLIEVANMCLQLGKWEEAERHVEAIRTFGDAAADDIAARAALGRGDYAAAETAARAATSAKNPQVRTRGHLVLGRLAVRMNDLASARAHADQARELSKNDRRPQSGLHMLRGDVLARTGNIPEAEKEFLEEIRLYPDRIDAKVSLATLYASANRRQDARRVIIDLVSKQPTPEAFLLGMRTFHATEDPEGERQLLREARRMFPTDDRFRAPRSKG